VTALAEAGVEGELRRLLSGFDHHDVALLGERAAASRRLVYEATGTAHLRTEIVEGYRALEQKCGANAAVAVRSSAAAEDLPNASFAGQHDSFLNVRGEDEVIEACRCCFASIFTDRAIVYRIDNGFDHFKVALSVGVMKMVRSDLAASRVIFTAERTAVAKSQIDLGRKERVREAVRRHLRTPTLGPKTLCRLVGMSRSNLYRLFENAGGVARYIQRERLLEARAVLSDLATTRSISAIAEELCFADASSFSRAFKREFGYRPSEVRSAALAGLAVCVTPRSRVLSDRADFGRAPPRILSSKASSPNKVLRETPLSLCRASQKRAGTVESPSRVLSGIAALTLGRSALCRDSRLILHTDEIAKLTGRHEQAGCSSLRRGQGRVDSRSERRLQIMTSNWKIAGLAACTGILIAMAAYAQTPTALEQAELAGLSPEMRAQVQTRAVGGNSVTEVLQVMLLNNIKTKHPASQIVAMDWATGVAVVEQSVGGMAAVHFDPSTLQIKS
jgi:AraC-like DNA-binding protein